jgi:hypothetical protein
MRRSTRQILTADRLGQMIKGAQPHRLDRVCRGRVRGQHGHRWRLGPCRDAAQYFEPVHPRHAQIEKHRICRLPIEHLQGLAAGRRRSRVMAEIAHHLGERLAHRLVVVDDQDGCHGGTISKVVPVPTPASRAVPPWAAAPS